MTWHPTNTEAALSLVALIIGGILLIWACLRPKYGKSAERPGDSPTARVRKPFTDYKTSHGCTVPTYQPMSYDGTAPGAIESAPPLRDKRGRFAAKNRNSLTKTQKNVSAKRTTAVKR